ncbi:hypothetical protein Tco_1415949 [Tanacetum coccineum]
MDGRMAEVCHNTCPGAAYTLFRCHVSIPLHQQVGKWAGSGKNSLVDDNADHVKDLSLLKEHVEPKTHSCDNVGIKEAIVSTESDNWNDRNDKSVAPSKELRLHWDLNTVMGEWVELCDDLVSERDPHDSYRTLEVASSSLFDDDDNYDEDAEEEEPRKELQTTSLPGDQLAIGKETGCRVGTNMYPSTALLGQHKDESVVAYSVDELIENADGFAGVFPGKWCLPSN